MVVGVDRLAHVLRRARGLEVARGREDRVDRVVGVLLLVVVGVDAVLAPSGRHELHPADRARGGDVQVVPVVGLDLVDRRQILPAHAVLDTGGLVDRQQEERDAELADDEVGDAVDRGRAGQRVEVGRVGAGGGAVGPAEARLGVALRVLLLLGLVRTLILSFIVRVVAVVGVMLRNRVALAVAVVRTRGAVVGAAALARVGARLARVARTAAGTAAAATTAAATAGRSAGRRNGRGRGVVGAGELGDQLAGQRDLVDWRAGRDVDRHRHDRAVGKAHLERPLLSGRC